jgi:hypothetical protein
MVNLSKYSRALEVARGSRGESSAIPEDPGMRWVGRPPTVFGPNTGGRRGLPPPAASCGTSALVCGLTQPPSQSTELTRVSTARSAASAANWPTACQPRRSRGDSAGRRRRGAAMVGSLAPDSYIGRGPEVV